jgi:Domain of unknown function (DUF4440)
MIPTLKRIATAGVIAAGLVMPAACAQEPPIDPELPRGISVDQIEQRFAAQEQEFKKAREQYTYRESVRVQTLDLGGQATGDYTETFDVTFDDRGQRVFKQVTPPHSTLRNVSVTKEDIDDIRNRMPFVLTSDELPDYEINYVGQQQLDSGNTFLFDITPKRLDPGRRYFEGRIWVDGDQFQIVKSYGKSVPDLYTRGNENLFPNFTTYRSLIDGKYWFPTSTRADDVLHFSGGDVRIREIVNYSNYQRFGSTSRIIFNGQELPSTSNPQPPVQVQGQVPAPLPTGHGSSNAPQQQSRGGALPQQTGGATAQPPAGGLTAVITELERQVSDAIVKRDINSWQRLLADGYTDVDSDGTVRDLNAMAEVIRSHSYDSITQGGLEVRIYGDAVVVVGTRTLIEKTRRGLTTATNRFTDVFLQRNGIWQLASSQSARLRTATAR